MIRKKSIVIFTAVILSIGIAVLISYSVRKKPAPDQKILLGVSYDPSSAPIFVALKKGFFKDEGLDASLQMFTTGKAALEAMQQGNVQFATVADTVLMFSGMDGKKIQAIATVADSSKHHKIIALKERGISVLNDLAGKKIGVSAGTSGEFFLYSFLLLKNIPFRTVHPVNIAPEEMDRALVTGGVDAVATWLPNVSRIAEKLGDRAVLFEDDNYLMTWNIVGHHEFMESKPELIKKMLKGLVRAAQYMETHPDEAIAITSEFSGFDAALLKTDWRNYHYDIRLSEALLINLEDQARWALKFYYRDRDKIPDFTGSIYAEALREIDPRSVSIRGKNVP